MSSKLSWISVLILTIFLTSSAVFTFVPITLANEIAITSNGTGSENEVAHTSDSQITVQQSSQGIVQNQTSSSSSTGNNQASANSAASTEINTGNVSTTNNITNSVNNSQVQIDCCSSSSSSSLSSNGINTISNNGDASINLIDQTKNQNQSVSANQAVTVINNIQGVSNTGSNTASDNRGNTTIVTGNVVAINQIDNTHINQTNVQAAFQQQNSLNILSNNGVGSHNNIQIGASSDSYLFNYSTATIINSINFLANTGANQASNNSGRTYIRTGDLLLINSIFNIGVNNNSINLGCNCTLAQIPPTDQSTTPNDPPAGGTNSDSSNNSTPPSTFTSSSSSFESSGGSVLGAAVGNLLPATGNNDLINNTLACLEIILLGLFLRINSKRLSQTFKFTKNIHFSSYRFNFQV